jgi:hypothetical protein
LREFNEIFLSRITDALIAFQKPKQSINKESVAMEVDKDNSSFANTPENSDKQQEAFEFSDPISSLFFGRLIDIKQYEDA